MTPPLVMISVLLSKAVDDLVSASAIRLGVRPRGLAAAFTGQELRSMPLTDEPGTG